MASDKQHQSMIGNCPLLTISKPSLLPSLPAITVIIINQYQTLMTIIVPAQLLVKLGTIRTTSGSSSRKPSTWQVPSEVLWICCWDDKGTIMGYQEGYGACHQLRFAGEHFDPFWLYDSDKSPMLQDVNTSMIRSSTTHRSFTASHVLAQQAGAPKTCTAARNMGLGPANTRETRG